MYDHSQQEQYYNSGVWRQVDSWVHYFLCALQKEARREPEDQAGMGYRDHSGQGHLGHWQIALTVGLVSVETQCPKGQSSPV